MSLTGCKILLWSFVIIWMFSGHTVEGTHRRTCGYSSLHSRFRIVGGHTSHRGMWPWQIGLYRRISKDVPEFLCGGALISRRWVLTAAHCFYKNDIFYGNASQYLIIAGDHSLSTNETSQQEVVPETIFVHHEFSHSSFVDGDIALAFLSKKININTFARPVCLPRDNEGDLAIPGTNGIVAGWGVTRTLRLGELVHSSERSDVLRHVAFTIKSDHLCLNKALITYNTKMTFCAGDGSGRSDACKGDSGGAFVRKIRRGSRSRWVAVGIVSWGKGCAQKDEYGYYTRVHPFIHWIRKTVKEYINECYKGNGGCSHGCVNTQGSYHCTCPVGFQLSNGRMCWDIDECSIRNGGCSHRCINTEGSFHCTCPKKGFQLSHNQRTCLSQCKDNNYHCSIMARYGYCRLGDVAYMKRHCKKSCNFCDGAGDSDNNRSGGTGDEGGQAGSNGSSVGAGSDSTCADKKPGCGYQALRGDCTKYPKYMNANCCVWCNHILHLKNISCTNRHDRCTFWANNGECCKSPAFMLDYCCAACKAKGYTVP